VPGSRSKKPQSERPRVERFVGIPLEDSPVGGKTQLASSSLAFPDSCYPSWENFRGLISLSRWVPEESQLVKLRERNKLLDVLENVGRSTLLRCKAKAASASRLTLILNL